MKFLMMIKHAEGAPGLEHPQGLNDAMGKFVEESFKSGILKDTGGLKRTAESWRIRSKGGKLSRTDGPFAESKEVIGGFAIVETKTREEAEAVAHNSWSCIASTFLTSSASVKCARSKTSRK